MACSLLGGALTADPMFSDGRFVDKPSAGLRAWGASMPVGDVARLLSG